jgi:hypothetical protein
LKNLLQDLTFTTTTPLKEDEIEIYSSNHRGGKFQKKTEVERG